MKKIFSVDNFLFAAIILIQIFLTFHGKQIGNYFFGDKELHLNSSFNNFLSWFSLFIIPASLTYLKENKKLKLNSLISIGVAIGVGVPVFFQVVFKVNSILIFTLQSYVFGISLVTIIIHRIFIEKYSLELYKLVFDKVLKIVGFILVVFVAGLATLRYVSNLNNEASIGFITTFAYPTVIVIASFIMLGYWVILPCWNEIINHYKVQTKLYDL